MNKKFKKISVSILAVLMLVCLSTVYAMAANHVSIPELLDGDKAFISGYAIQDDDTTESGKFIRTGTAPFDADDLPGNDSGSLNNIVRTFDSLTYTAEFYTSLQPETILNDISGYKNGSIYFEYILPATKSEAVFDTAGMGWLQTMPEIVYEIKDVVVNGIPSQVLHGSYLLTPSKGNPSAVGQSYNNIDISVRILDMKNGETFQPIFTTWLKDNNVGTTYHGKNAGIPDTVVYGSDHVCDTHGRVEYASFTAPPVLVSAAPSYNVEIVKTSHPNNTKVDTFDMNTGNDNALMKDLGTVNGRMYGFGLSLQIVGNGTKGMMGIELPDGNDINFDLELTTSYIKGGSVIKDVELEDGYKAFLWSGDANVNSASASNGRTTQVYTPYILGGIPFNKDTNSVYDLKNQNDFAYCKDGGTWTFTADENDPSKIHVTVSGYEVDLTALPYNTTNTEKPNYNSKWYNPNEIGLTEEGRIDQYWKVRTAVLSAGKMWVVQPYYNTVPLAGSFTDKSSTDFSQVHIKDYYGAGTINTGLEDYDLDMISVTGKTTLDCGQAVDTDDYKVYDYAFERPGSESTTVIYTRSAEKGRNNPLTDDCASSNADWAVSGQKIGIRAVTTSSNAEGLASAVAMSQVIKFDDVFFEPSSTSVTNTSGSGTYSPSEQIFWGAKKDKTGWNHMGLKPDQAGYDNEMLTTTADDLIWYKSLDELKADGYIPVAVLQERRGLTSVANGGYNQMYLWVYGSIKTDCAIEYGYLTTCEGYIWSKNDIVDTITVKTGKKIVDITDADYSAFVKSDSFFTRESGAKISDDVDLMPHYIKNGKTNSGFVSSIKGTYENGIYVLGSGAPYYIDTCYVIPFKTKIVKKVAQKTDTGEIKKIYDLSSGQRVADYVLNPTIERGEVGGYSNLDKMSVTVTVIDTLPKGLNYKIGSAYYSPDGSAVYKQDGNCQLPGTITGAESFAPTTVVVNDDGTTTITWTIKNVTIDPQQATTDVGLIWFSADIGTPMNEATDVVNQQELVNNVIVYSDYDYNTIFGVDGNGNIIDAFSLEKGNLSVAAIRVLKQKGFSICKVSDHDAIDKGEPIEYTMYLGNNKSLSMKNSIFVDNLPYNGDECGSHFIGERYVTGFTGFSQYASAYKNFRFFYTTNKDFRGIKSVDFTQAGYTADTFANSADWHELYLNTGNIEKNLFTNLPSVAEQKGDNEIVSIVGIGNIEAEQVVSMRCELSAPHTDTNDKLVNTFSCDKLVSYANNVVISRAITGTIWADVDNDGVKDEDEDYVEDTTITLLIKDETGNYVPYIPVDPDGNPIDLTIKPGETINITTGEITPAGPGEYGFDGLPTGDYAVIFSGDRTESDIVMPTASELKGSEKHEVIVNVGLTTVAVTMNKTWNDKDDLDKLRGDYGVTLYADGVPASKEVILDKETLTYTWTKLPYAKDGVPIKYTVVETTIPKGYTPIYDGFDIVNEHTPAKKYLPVVFFAPDNIGYYIADGITYYSTPYGQNKKVSHNTIFHDSTTIYVERGEMIAFKPYTMFTSFKGDYVASLKSGENSATALPFVVEAEDDGYYHFRVVDNYYFVTLVQYVENKDTGEKLPWYQFLIDMIKKIADFFKNLFN